MTRLALGVLILTFVSVASGAIGADRGQAAGYAFALAAGCAGGAIVARCEPIAPVIALLAVGGMLGTPLVIDAGANAATLTVVAACVVGALRSQGKLYLPSRPTLLALGVYVAVLCASTLTSVAHGTSVSNVAGTVGVLAVAFVAAPTLVRGEWGRVLGGLAAIGALVAASSFALWRFGAMHVASQRMGVYDYLQLTIGGSKSSIVLPRATGVYMRPAGAALTLTVGCIAALAVAPSVSGWARKAALAGATLSTVAALLTFARTAQLGLAVGGLFLLLFRRWRREILVIAVTVLAIAVGWAMAANKFGGVDRLDVTVSRYGRGPTQAIVNGPSAIENSVGYTARGGTDLSGRDALWRASREAISERPVLGSGPGTDAAAIAPHLSGPYLSYRGLSSHSTPLRVGVETGALGLLSLGAVHVTAAAAALRRRAPWALPLGAVVVSTLGLGLPETLGFGGFLLASLAWALGVGALSCSATGTTVAELVRPLRWGAARAGSGISI